MITPPLSISAKPRFTPRVPCTPEDEPPSETMTVILPGSRGRPRAREIVTNVAKQPRNGLGARNDGEEIRVERPARNDVLVQVTSNSGAGNGALVHSEVESVTAGHV